MLKIAQRSKFNQCLLKLQGLLILETFLNLDGRTYTWYDELKFISYFGYELFSCYVGLFTNHDYIGCTVSLHIRLI